MTHKGRAIQVLDGAETGDPLDYRIEPPLSHAANSDCPIQYYSTVADAIEKIDKFKEEMTC
jgi:hypothetical protein